MEKQNVIRRIVTHDDFDGVVSGALCAAGFGVRDIQFAAPLGITESRFLTTDTDVVCDLPYPLECGLWFDHHPGNLEELQYRGIDPVSLAGRFDLQPSCAHVIRDYFLVQGISLPRHAENLVEEADRIDAFAYRDIADWQKVTPGKQIDKSLKVQDGPIREKREYMRWLILELAERSLEETESEDAVQRRVRLYDQEEQRMLHQIGQDARFLDRDTEHELVIVDLTRHNRRPVVIKNLAYLLYPDALGVIEVKNRFLGDRKTNDLSFSMALSLNVTPRSSGKDGKDVGEIMRQLNIGDGHAGAGAGRIACRTKEDMLKTKAELLNRMYELWSRQSL